MKLKIVTFNMRCLWCSPEYDGVNSFVHRAGLIWEKINKEKPDVIAFQEGMDMPIKYLKECLPDYLILGHGRLADYSSEGVYTAIRKSSLTLAGMDVFWMSPTPYVPGSRFEKQSEYPRTCVATRLFHNETKKTFMVYNVHLDHISTDARIEGLQCVLERMRKDREMFAIPSVLLGDFNDVPESGLIEFCNTYEPYPQKDITAHINTTFHDFGRREDDFKIDYIYVSEDILDKVQSVQIWDDSHNGIYLSDHYPVCAELEI